MFKDSIKYLLLAAALMLAPSAASAATSYPFIKPSIAAVEALGAACPTTVAGVWIPNVGHYAWNGSSTATADGVNILQCTGVVTGRMIIDEGPLALASITAMQALPGPVANMTVDVAGTQGGRFVATTVGSACVTDNGTKWPANDGTLICWNRQYFGAAVPVTWWNAVGDGTTIDTTAEQNALNAACSLHKELDWPDTGSYYLTDNTLTITCPVTIGGTGEVFFSKSNSPGFVASNISDIHFVSKLKIVGPQYTTYQALETAIWIHGTRNAGAAPTFINDISLDGPIIWNWGSTGAEVDYATDFKSHALDVQNVGYVGLGTESVNGCVISDLYVNGVVAIGDPSGNAYGLTLTKATDDSGDLTSQPRTTNCAVTNPVILNVPNWINLDTHCGSNISISNPVLINGTFLLHVGPCLNSVGTYTFAPLNVSISGGSLDSGVTDGSHDACVQFEGAAPELATGSVSGVSMQNCGNQSTNTDGALQAVYTSALSVTGDTFYEVSPTAIYLGGYNKGFTLSGNTMVSPWSTSAGAAWGSRLVGDYNVGLIGNNSFLTGPKSATYVLTQGISLSAGTGENVQLGTNLNQATVPYVGTFVSSLFQPNLPTVCGALPTGTVWNNAGVLNVCP